MVNTVPTLPERAEPARGARRPSASVLAAVAGALALLLFCVDLASPGVNIALLYAVVILIPARVLSTRALWQLALVLVLMTYVGYVVKTFVPWAGPFNEFSDYRLFNRTLAAALILAVVPMTRFLLGGTADRWLDGGVEQDRDEFDRLILWLLPAVAAVLAATLTVAVILTDFVIAAPYNLSILYGFVLLAIAVYGRRRALWVGLLVSLTLTFMGYYLGPKAADEFLPPVLISNRFLSATVQTLLVGVLHWWLTLRKSRASTTL